MNLFICRLIDEGGKCNCKMGFHEKNIFEKKKSVIDN